MPLQKKRRRKRSGVGAKAKLKTKICKNDRKIVDCLLCPTTNDGETILFKNGTFKGFKSHLNKYHVSASWKNCQIYKVVGYLDEWGRKINPKKNPFFGMFE